MRNLSVALVFLAASSLHAQSLQQKIDRDLPSLIETYKTLHAAPELSMQEAKSSALVAARLRELGYDVTERVGKYEQGEQAYGVVAVLRNGKGPTVLLRSDMDGLPVQEQTGLPYASTVRTKNPAGDDVPVMHACGHDLHMTALMGAAKLLAESKGSWKGTLVLVGQPSEEIGRGAQALMRDRLYERFPRPDYAVAIHDWATLEAGKVTYVSGYAMAAIDAVNVTIQGVGGHGAAPQLTKDPIVMSAQFINALQTISSRERSAVDPVVVTVGSIHGGTKRNVIPDQVKLELTVRTFKPEVRSRVLDSIGRIAKGVALAAGVPEDRQPIVEVLEHEKGEATYNDPQLTSRLVTALGKALGASNVVAGDPATVSEDFGTLGDHGKIPTAILFVGAGDAQKIAAGQQPGLHSSRFAPVVEPALRTAIETLVTSATELLK